MNACPLPCRAEFHPDGEDAGPGDDEWPEDTGDGWAWPVLPLTADVNAGGHWRLDRCAGVLVRHQTSSNQASLQPAAPVWGSAGETATYMVLLTLTHIHSEDTNTSSRCWLSYSIFPTTKYLLTGLLMTQRYCFLSWRESFVFQFLWIRHIRPHRSCLKHLISPDFKEHTVTVLL